MGAFVQQTDWYYIEDIEQLHYEQHLAKYTVCISTTIIVAVFEEHGNILLEKAKI